MMIYRLSSRELNRGLGRQVNTILKLPRNSIIPQIDIDFDELRTKQLQESTNRLVHQLYYYNLGILILSAIGCYFLAKKTLDPVEEMVKAQNHFTADASHELKTPLAAMRTEIEVGLRDKKLNLDNAKEMLSSNLDEIGRLETLSNALLKLARYQDEVQMNFQNLSLEDIVIEAYEKVASLAEGKGVEFENDLQKVEIAGDSQSLVELFVILLDNAIKYSHDKSRIYLSLYKEKDHVIFKIKDEGIGIKASDLSHIFDRFYRADTSRCKEKVSGYGLGLSIAKRIVELHNGKITVQSTPGKGSEFKIKF